jgi:hypothetical protein
MFIRDFLLKAYIYDLHGGTYPVASILRWRIESIDEDWTGAHVGVVNAIATDFIAFSVVVQKVVGLASTML